MLRLPMPRFLFALLLVLIAACSGAAAQDRGTVDPKPLPPLEKPDDPNTPAKELFGRKTAPVAMEARSIGYYTHGCLAGGRALPINGPTWQVMRLSRNRNWGHPNLIKYLERFANKAPSIGWPGCWSATWRSHAAVRCSPDMEPPGRARRRHLAHADAGSRTDSSGTRGDVGDQRRRRRLE